MPLFTIVNGAGGHVLRGEMIGGLVIIIGYHSASTQRQFTGILKSWTDSLVKHKLRLSREGSCHPGLPCIVSSHPSFKWLKPYPESRLEKDHLNNNKGVRHRLGLRIGWLASGRLGIFILLASKQHPQLDSCTRQRTMF